MPNWCNVQVRVCGPEDHRKRFLNGLNKNSKDGKVSVLDTYHPLPEDIGDGWYNWCVTHWGTKWADDMFVLCEDLNDEIHLSGDTAWSPPIEGYTSVSEQFPALTFEMVWDEGGMCFMGAAIIRDGRIIGFSEKHDMDYPSCEDWDDPDQVDAFMEAVSDGRDQCLTEALQAAAGR